MPDPELEFMSEKVSIPEFRELSPIEESAIEHVPSSGSVLCVLLIHLNYPDKIFVLQAFVWSSIFDPLFEVARHAVISLCS